ncbi:hypothetical protein [Tsukamurella pseudospumae]|uniref:Uncharacterized protein n=1 Tax=Tsukamurella pseudospumae TaxID=239498 RepID=A0A138AMC3_9ACTN|nr:hypothetical protein [Tsukamurella pseudospumae]KXP11626.1 hypothetical protein AXK60_24760 [Tsukamurella pseudospumae]
MSDSSPYTPDSTSPASAPQQSNVLAAIIVALALLLGGLMSWHPWSGDPEPRLTTITKTYSNLIDREGKPKVEYTVDCVQSGEQLTCDWDHKN